MTGRGVQANSAEESQAGNSDRPEKSGDARRAIRWLLSVGVLAAAFGAGTTTAWLRSFPEITAESATAPPPSPFAENSSLPGATRSSIQDSAQHHRIASANVDPAGVSSEETVAAQQANVEDAPADQAERQSPPDMTVAKSAASKMAEGDRLIYAGQVGAALRQYEDLAASSQHLSDELRYRMAICAESLGDVDRALDEYRWLATQSQKPRVVYAAQRRQVYIWMQLGRPELAKELLWKFILAPDARGLAREEVRGEFLHLIGQVLATEALAGTSQSLLADHGITYPRLRWTPEQALHWLTSEANQPEGEPSEVLSNVEVEVRQRLGSRPEEIRLAVQLRNIPLASAIEMILQQAELEVIWSSEAREAVAGHSAVLAHNDLDLATLLDGLLNSLDLYWQFEDGSLSLHRFQELGRESAAGIRFDVATRALRQAVVAYPGHHLTDEAYWSLGNLAFARANLPQALIYYQQYLRQFAHARGHEGVHFNVGKTQLLLGNGSHALESFYHVVDAAPDQQLAPAAYVYLGRLYLENDQPRRAIRPLSRAVALVRHQQQQLVAALLLASAYMLADNPHAANQVLMDHRQALLDSDYRDKAAFLAAAARYRAAASDNRQRHARALVEALSHLDHSEFFGAHYYVLVAQTYRDLELLEPIHHVAARGLEQARWGTIRQRLKFILAEYFSLTGNREEAQITFELVRDSGVQPWAEEADLRLAHLAFQNDDKETFLATCRRLLKPGQDEMRQLEVLRLLGRFYEQQGAHDKAALCYSGVVPKEVERP